MKIEVCHLIHVFADQKHDQKENNFSTDELVLSKNSAWCFKLFSSEPAY
jgi:hypothetical protein